MKIHSAQTAPPRALPQFATQAVQCAMRLSQRGCVPCVTSCLRMSVVYVCRVVEPPAWQPCKQGATRVRHCVHVSVPHHYCQFPMISGARDSTGAKLGKISVTSRCRESPGKGHHARPLVRNREFSSWRARSSVVGRSRKHCPQGLLWGPSFKQSPRNAQQDAQQKPAAGTAKRQRK